MRNERMASFKGASRSGKLTVALLTFFSCLLLVNPTESYGQATSGSVSGFVTDPSGAAVPGAEVTLTDVNKGVAFTVSSNEGGFFIKPQIPAGNYTVKVSKAGFKTFVRSNVLVSYDTGIKVDAALEVGEVSQEVAVSDAAPLLKTEKADVSTIVENRLVKQLPVIGRNWAFMQLLVAGAVLQGANQTGFVENPQQSPNVSSNGLPNGARNMQLDGVDNNDSILGQQIITPNLDSIREFKVTTTNYDAEFGRAGGAVTQLETLSGTNSIHGTAFWYHRNDATNARNPFNEPNGPPPFKWNQFGGSVGGPIKTNKTFFFADFQGARNRLSGGTLASVPTARMRNGDFSEFRDFNGNLIPIFDPDTGDANGNGRTAFAGNLIPASRINSIARNYINFMPLPNQPGIENNFVTSASTSFDTHQPSVRIDHYLTDSTRLFGRYTYFRSLVNSPPIFGFEAGGRPVTGGIAGRSYGRNHNTAINLNHSFRPTLFMDVRYGYSRYNVEGFQSDNVADLAARLGFPANPNGPPTVSIQGIGGFSLGPNGGIINTLNYNQQAANMTWIKGTHSVKFGADVRQYGNRRDFPSGRTGSYTFQPEATASGVVNSGNGIASFLLGEANNYGRNLVVQEGSQAGTEYEKHNFFYFQDQWKITSKLTFNFGVRYEVYTQPATEKGLSANFDFKTAEIIVAGFGDISRSTNIKADKNNFAPRLGLAYQLTPKTVVRIGAGRSHYPNVFNVLVSQSWPVFDSAGVSSAIPFIPVINLSDPVPSFSTFQVPSSGRIPYATYRARGNSGVTGNEPNRRSAYADSWNLSVQREIAQNTSVTLAYVGTVGRQLYWNYNSNSAAPGPGPRQERRPWFQRFGINDAVGVRTNAGSSSYHAMQIEFKNQVSRDFSFLGSYTWSKTIDFGLFGNGADAVTGFNWDIDRGLANRHRTGVLAVGYVWELPFGKGKHLLSNVTGVARQIVEGWQLSGITRAQSGRPFSPTVPAGVCNCDIGFLVANRVGDPKVDNPTRDRWFNPSAFVSPAPFQLGTAGRNSLIGPGLLMFDMDLKKGFPLSEQKVLEFRLQAFNAFNRTNLTIPGENHNVLSPNAGRIFGLVENMRQLQYGLHLRW